MALKDDIRKIAEQDKAKGGLSPQAERPALNAIVTPPVEPGEDGIKSPVTFEVLEWDDTKDIVLSGGDIVKTALTATITDANGTVILIDEIIYPDLEE